MNSARDTRPLFSRAADCDVNEEGVGELERKWGECWDSFLIVRTRYMRVAIMVLSFSTIHIYKNARYRRRREHFCFFQSVRTKRVVLADYLWLAEI